MATLTVPPVLTSPRDDAIQLHSAFKGFGCVTEDIVNILAFRNAVQRALIQQEYRTMYSEDLNKRLSSVLSGKLGIALPLWIYDGATRDAVILRRALHGDVINLEAATEVICSRTSSQIHTVKQIYHSRFGEYLENHVAQQTSGDLGKLISHSSVSLMSLACLTTQRYEGFEVDMATVEKDAKALFRAGQKKLGTDEIVFISIFSERSRAHLAAVDRHYRDVYGRSLKKAVKSVTSGKFELALLTILECSINPAKYFAKVLHNAMKGFETNDSTLIRVIVTRAEIDMQYIKVEYLKKYKKTLNDAVHSATAGDYRTFLLSLLGPNH